MELKNKKIAFLGDSITEGAGVQTPDSVYWRQIATNTGAQCYGYGVCGSRIVPQCPNKDDDKSFGSRVGQMIPDADVVVVFGGTNDFDHGYAAIGTIKDRTNETFYGACYCLIMQLIDRYPGACIVMMTPLHRESEEELSNNDPGGRRCGTLFAYAQAIREVAELFGVPIVDLFHNCTIQPRIPALKEKYMPDGLHPNDAGHVLITKCLLSVLEQL